MPQQATVIGGESHLRNDIDNSYLHLSDELATLTNCDVYTPGRIVAANGHDRCFAASKGGAITAFLPFDLQGGERGAVYAIAATLIRAQQSGGAWAETDIATSQSSGAWRGTTFDEFVLCSNGTNYPKKVYKYGSTWYCENWGMQPPTTAPAVQSGSGGYARIYKYCYYNSKTGHQSGFSTTDTSTASTSATVRVTGTAESGIDYVVIYSTKSGPGTLYYRAHSLTTIANPGAGLTSDWTDGNDDADLTEPARVDDLDYELDALPPIGTWYSSYDRRVWASGKPSSALQTAVSDAGYAQCEEGYLYCSEFDYPEGFPTSFKKRSLTEGNDISCHAKAGDRLAVFTKQAIYLIQAVENQIYSVGVKRDNPKNGSYGGTESPHSVVQVGASLIYYNRHGIFLFDGYNDPVLLSGTIQGTIDALTYSVCANFVGAFDEAKNVYRLYCQSSGESYNDTRIDVLLGEGERQQPRCAVVDCNRVKVAGQASYLDENSATRYVFIGDNDGFIARENTSTHLGGFSGTVTGTASSGSRTTIVSTGFTASNAYAGAPVTIVAGTNSGETVRVASNTATTLTMEGTGYTAAISSTSQFRVGLLKPTIETGWFTLGNPIAQAVRISNISITLDKLSYSGNALISGELYTDFGTTAVDSFSFNMDEDYQNNVDVQYGEGSYFKLKLWYNELDRIAIRKAEVSYTVHGKNK